MNPFTNPTGQVQVPPPAGGIPGVPPQYTAKYKWSAFRFTGTVAPGDKKVFTNKQGDSNVQGFSGTLTERETCMAGTGGQVPNGVNWLVLDIGIYFDLNAIVATPAILLDAQVIMNSIVVVLDYNDQPYPLGPATMYPAGGGIAGTPDSASTGTGAAWTNGTPQMIGRRTQGDRPFILQGGTQFDVNLRCSNTSGAIRTVTTSAAVDVFVGLWVWEEKATQAGP